MKVTMLCFLVLVAVASAIPQKYTDRYDNTNVEEVLKNKRLLRAYVLCALEKGKCTPEGRELSSHIKEALENNCANCTEVQRSKSRTVISRLINHEPEFWTQLSEKFDPQRKFVQIYEKELRAIKA